MGVIVGWGELRGNIGAFALPHKHMNLSEIYVTIVSWLWGQRMGMRVLRIAGNQRKGWFVCVVLEKCSTNKLTTNECMYDDGTINISPLTGRQSDSAQHLYVCLDFH